MPSTTIVNSPLSPTTVSSRPSWQCGIGLRAPASKSQRKMETASLVSVPSTRNWIFIPGASMG